MKVAEASAPATIANLGPGFDIVGMAIEGFRDRVRLEILSGESVEVRVEGAAAQGVAVQPEKNSASVAALKVFELAGERRGFRLRLRKEVPVGAGLGSSGASAAAGAYAANLLLGEPLTLQELVKCAAEGERVACGSPHLDNVAPSLYGGFTLILDVEKPEILGIKPTMEFEVVVATPRVKLPENKTEYARRVLPEKIELELMVRQQASVARLVASILRGDLEGFGKAVSSDYIIEPARARLIPGFHRVKETALREGALGLSISGAGPSVFAVIRPGEAGRVVEAIKREFNSLGVEAEIFVTKPSIEGARRETIEDP